MIPPNELRVGSWIMDADPYDDIFQVRWSHIASIIENGSKYRPIPISEEWLYKLGFEKSVENAGNLPCWKKGKITIAKWDNEKWQIWLNTVDIYKSPQNIHSLQNLVLSLTGEDLTINWWCRGYK